MATNFPTSLDTLINPTATDKVSTTDHASQHSNTNDALEALEAKVGINSSAVTTTHDYKLSGVTGSDKAGSLTGTETLTNKTLTQPVVASMYQDAEKTKLMTLPNTASDTLTANTATQSLTNKTITDSTNNVMAKSLKSATTTVDVSEATAPTSGQVLTATSDTTATWQTINAGYTAKTLFPLSPLINGFAGSGIGIAKTVSSNTTMYVGQIVLQHSIVANKVSIYSGNTVTVAGTVDLTLYAEDGQSQIFSVTTGSISASSTIYTTALSAVLIPAGIYYIALNSNGTFNGDIHFYSIAPSGVGSITAFQGGVTSEPIMQGQMTITASTPPATFNPVSSITATVSDTLAIRLDN
jgi:hypothetical protein